MPRLVQYPIDDTVECILTNSSAGTGVSDDVREALSVLVGCSVRSKTFKVKDMVKLLPGDSRDDGAIEELKLKSDSVDKLDAISSDAAAAVVDVLDGYNAKAKNVQVIANNIRLGKVKVEKPQDTAADTEKPADALIAETDKHDNATADTAHDTDITDESVSQTDKANEPKSDAADSDSINPADTINDDGTADSDTTNDESHRPDFTAMLHDDDAFSTEFDDDSDDDDDDAPVDIEINDASDTKDDTVENADDEIEEFGDDDGDDVNGYVDEDAPIDIDTDAYRDEHRFMIPDNDNKTVNNTDTDTAEPADIDDILASADDTDNNDENAVESDETDEKPVETHDAVDTHIDDEKPVNASTEPYMGTDEYFEADEQHDDDTHDEQHDDEQPVTVVDNVEAVADEHIDTVDEAPDKTDSNETHVENAAVSPADETNDTDNANIVEVHDDSVDSIDTHDVETYDDDTQNNNDASDDVIVTPINESDDTNDNKPVASNEQQHDGELDEKEKKDEQQNDETVDNAADSEEHVEKPTDESDKSSDSNDDKQSDSVEDDTTYEEKPNVNQIPVAIEVDALRKRITDIDDPKKVQEEFDKLSPEAKEALADFANEQAKAVEEQKDAPDTTGGLPEFARELEAERKAAAEAAAETEAAVEEIDKETEETIDDVPTDMDSGIGDPDIIDSITEDLDEPDFDIANDTTDFSESNPIVSGMLDKMYDGHGINGKSACVMLCVVFLVLAMIPFAGVINQLLCGIDSFSFISDPLFVLKAIGILTLLFIVTRTASLTAQSRAYRKNYEELNGKAERTAYRFYEPGIRAEFMFPSRSFGESLGRSIMSAVAGLALAASLSLCVIDAPIAGMVIMAVSIISLIALGCRPLVNPEFGTDKTDLSDETERYIEDTMRANKHKDCWMLGLLFLSFMTCVSLGNSIGLTLSPISMFFSPTLSVTLPGFTAFGIAGVLAIAHAFMATIGLNKKPLSMLWTLVKSAAVLFAGLGIGVMLTIVAATSMMGLILIAVVAVCFYLAATSSGYKADLPIKRH